MYADDTTLSINGKNIFEIEATLNEDLNSVNMWCTNNDMVINPTKSTCMLIGRKQRKAMMEKEFKIYISNETSVDNFHHSSPPLPLRRDIKLHH